MLHRMPKEMKKPNEAIHASQKRSEHLQHSTDVFARLSQPCFLSNLLVKFEKNGPFSAGKLPGGPAELVSLRGVRVPPSSWSWPYPSSGRISGVAGGLIIDLKKTNVLNYKMAC